MGGSRDKGCQRDARAEHTPLIRPGVLLGRMDSDLLRYFVGRGREQHYLSAVVMFVLLFGAMQGINVYMTLGLAAGAVLLFGCALRRMGCWLQTVDAKFVEFLLMLAGIFCVATAVAAKMEDSLLGVIACAVLMLTRVPGTTVKPSFSETAACKIQQRRTPWEEEQAAGKRKSAPEELGSNTV